MSAYQQQFHEQPNPYNAPNGYVPPQQSAYPQLSSNHQHYTPQYEEYVPNPNAKGMSVETGDRFDYSSSKYKDKFYAILFFLHLLAIVVCAVVFGHYVKEHMGAVDPSDTDALQITGKQLLGSLGAAALSALVFGAIWLSIMKKCSDTIITISLILNCVILVGMAGFALYKQAFWMAIVFAICALLQGLYFYCVRNRIPFTQAVISASVSSVQDNAGAINVAYFCALLQVVWVCGWGFTTAAITYHFNLTEKDGVTATHGVMWFFLLVSFYWTGQVLKNVAHVSVAGTVASWWLVPSTPSPTCGALKRACTTSFGSICFGSLLVAVLQALRAVVKQARESARRSDNGAAACALCCLECIINQLDNLIQYFNMYAYTHVAIYGKDFMSSAKDTWKMFCDRGFEVLINDDLTGLVLTMGCFLGAIVSCLVGGGVGFALADNTQYTWETLAAVSFLIGFVMTGLIMGVVQSAVATTYVVWAEMPNEISNTRPQHYNKLVDAAKILHPGQNF